MNTLQFIIYVSAVIVSAVLAVILTKVVDHYGNRRKDRVDIFKTLVSCSLGEVSYRKTDALNLIKVIYYGCNDVIVAYNNYMDSLSANSSSIDEDIKDNWIKLLETMALCLGYTNIKWDTLKKTYKPVGLANSEQIYHENAIGYNELIKLFLNNPEIVQKLLQPQNSNSQPIANNNNFPVN